MKRIPIILLGSLTVLVIGLLIPHASGQAQPNHDPGQLTYVYLSLVLDQTPSTTLISMAEDGTLGNSSSSNASISYDGRFVAFASRASTLVPDDNNDYADIFVHDRQTEMTSRVSVSSDGVEGDYWSTSPSI